MSKDKPTMIYVPRYKRRNIVEEEKRKQEQNGQIERDDNEPWQINVAFVVRKLKVKMYGYMVDIQGYQKALSNFGILNATIKQLGTSIFMLRISLRFKNYRHDCNEM